jgi:hypothetical protein
MFPGKYLNTYRIYCTPPYFPRNPALLFFVSIPDIFECVTFTGKEEKAGGDDNKNDSNTDNIKIILFNDCKIVHKNINVKVIN